MIPVRQNCGAGWSNASARFLAKSETCVAHFCTFEQALAGHIGIRSGRIAREAATILIEKGIEEKKPSNGRQKLQIILGKLKRQNQKIRSLTPKLNS